MLTESSLVKDLLINNGIGGVAFFGVQLADAVQPIPSTFWQAFAVLALNTVGTFAWRWYREVRKGKRREAEVAEKLDNLIADVKQLRTDFDNSQKAPARRRRN